MFRVEGEPDSLALALKLLDEAGVGLAPGDAFGVGGEGYLRLCFATSTSRLSEAMDRLEPFFS
jgi:aspartate/methionine/tyrosine aminotransferase